MYNVVGVRFKKAGKIYFFDPDGIVIERGQFVVVETARGIEFGNVVIANKLVDEDDVVLPLKKFSVLPMKKIISKLRKTGVRQRKLSIFVCKRYRSIRLR